MTHSPGGCIILSRSFAVALLLGLAAASCGQSQKEASIAGIHGTLRMRIASYDDRAETFYRLVTGDGETLHLEFGGSPPYGGPAASLARRGGPDGSPMPGASIPTAPTD